MAFYGVQNCKLCPELRDFVWISFSAYSIPRVGRQRAAQDIVEHDAREILQCQTLVVRNNNSSYSVDLEYHQK